MKTILDYIAKYGGAGGLIASLCVYMLCTNAMSGSNEKTSQKYELIEYRMNAIEKADEGTKNQFSEIQKMLTELKVDVSRIETLIERKRKN
jgi:chaperonin cofactor prefoldin